jgi:hypothetical protein
VQGMCNAVLVDLNPAKLSRSRHQARRTSNSFGESNEKDLIMRRRWAGPAFDGARLKPTFSLIRQVSERVEPG